MLERRSLNPLRDVSALLAGARIGKRNATKEGWLVVVNHHLTGTRGETMFAAVSQSAPLPDFPRGVDVRWETVRRTVWNEQKHAREVQELVYEISWIEE